MKWTKSQRLELIEKYRQSKQPQGIWCKENNIKLATLRYWLKQESKSQTIKQDLKPVKWIEVDTLPPNQSTTSLVKITMGQIMVEFSGNIEMPALQTIMKLMTDLC